MAEVKSVNIVKKVDSWISHHTNSHVLEWHLTQQASLIATHWWQEVLNLLANLNLESEVSKLQVCQNNRKLQLSFQLVMSKKFGVQHQQRNQNQQQVHKTIKLKSTLKAITKVLVIWISSLLHKDLQDKQILKLSQVKILNKKRRKLKQWMPYSQELRIARRIAILIVMKKIKKLQKSRNKSHKKNHLK